MAIQAAATKVYEVCAYAKSAYDSFQKMEFKDAIQKIVTIFKKFLSENQSTVSKETTKVKVTLVQQPEMPEAIRKKNDLWNDLITCVSETNDRGWYKQVKLGESPILDCLDLIKNIKSLMNEMDKFVLRKEGDGRQAYTNTCYLFLEAKKIVDNIPNKDVGGKFANNPAFKDYLAIAKKEVIDDKVIRGILPPSSRLKKGLS